MTPKTIHSPLLYILLCIILAVTGSCKDDPIYDDRPIAEGQCNITATVRFKSFTPAMNGKSRTGGRAIEEISSLWVLLYNEDNTLFKSYEITKSDNADEQKYTVTSSEGSTLPTAKFNLTVPFGRYYIYAVANMDLSQEKYKDAISTVDGLKNLDLTWDLKDDDSTDIAANSEMFGHFTVKGKDESSELSIINSRDITMHAELCRAASKVTVAYDGSRLEEDVHIYIKSVTIKDIPLNCHLESASAITAEYGSLIEEGEKITYTTESQKTDEAHISKATPYYYYTTEGVSLSSEQYDTDEQKSKARKEAHAESNEALFFYENCQGYHEDKDKTRPNDNTKEGMPYGTYIEVEAYYESNNVESLGSGDIKYRFMLGQDIVHDYNAFRNCHYKLTLVFNRFADDPDWHIYKERFLEVTQPKVVNYQGKIFEPDSKYPNLGHQFSPDNTIQVTSFEENKTTHVREPLKWTVKYLEEGQSEPTDKCPWISYTTTNEGIDTKVVFHATQANEDEGQPYYKEFKIDDQFETSPVSNYNLADPGNPASSDIKATANCYIVSAPGTYRLPLIYGNAINNGTNSSSYSGGYFKYYLNKKIEDPSIKKSGTPQKAELIWQDEENLIDTKNIIYNASDYNSTGGITFTVNSPLKQGNAVIAIKDKDNKVMWSWHIWFTTFKCFEDEDKTITVQNHDKNNYVLLPVNLGWCSEHDDIIKYYKGRKCKVIFTAGEGSGALTRTITIEQKSHIAFTPGNNPYYQWGRKDPFVGTNASWANKTRYPVNTDYVGWGGENPVRFYNDYSGDAINKGKYGEDIYKKKDAAGKDKDTYDEARETTIALFDRAGENRLIQSPEAWHNPTRKSIPNTSAYESENDVDGVEYLWGNNTSIKTIYDPCPVGYKTPSYKAFTGFTTTGDIIDLIIPNKEDWYYTDNESHQCSKYWYDVMTFNIADNNHKYELYEFYTDTSKLQSIIFPETGYRDWDSNATVYYCRYDKGGIGYSWTREIFTTKNPDAAYNFEFSREVIGGKNVRPTNPFYTCDGMPIRPCRE